MFSSNFSIISHYYRKNKMENKEEDYKIGILGIPMYCRSLNSAVEDLVSTCMESSDKVNRCISATGAHGLVTARKDATFAAVLKSFYRNLPDGMPGVWVGRFKGAREMERCYGPDFFEGVIRKSAGFPVGHFFCGGKEGVAEELAAACRKKFGDVQIAGWYCPPFREMSDSEMEELGEKINESGADVVWIGLSTPKQERFALRLARFVEVHFIVAVGAAFDFHTGRVRQAPRWVQRSGLEWFFRLITEPKRLYKRYLEIVPAFIYYNVVEWVGGKRE
jgi:N-acetylglucosaminyldiphosphoundecaprenol N-acetyl-beta-D-mannosaminyltransferase